MDTGRQRVVIEGVQPEIDCGAYAIKRTVGEKIRVEADVFAEGHDQISCVLRYRKVEAAEPEADGAARSDTSATWHEVPMHPLGNDRWWAEFAVDNLGEYRYTICGWTNRFKTWAGDLGKRIEAGQELSIDLQIGAGLVEEAAASSAGDDAARLSAFAVVLRGGGSDAAEMALSPRLADLMVRSAERSFAVTYDKELPVTVDRERARNGAWYEMFPRSASPDPTRPGTFRDVEARLPYVAEMGFDILYLPPIHPIGRRFRKGRNNAVQAEPDSPGSPWAIGGVEGGHRAVNPEMGTVEDFRRLVARARDYGIEIALDLAYQASADHPYLQEHPEWFRQRPDGTIQYAENPPKKYQDIYPFDFESEAWQTMWQEFYGIAQFWLDQGIRIFRVDNPHTKTFAFWQWLIAGIRRDYPETIFLAEAFTRPKVMMHLAKLGFTQSYTYFAWRNTKRELVEYFTELTQTQIREYYRPNLWPNTPDILTEYLQAGGRPAFVVRLVLAATLGASYGIYGPAFELHENQAIEFGKEEYLNSEKYEIRHWDLDRPDSLRHVIARVNAIRRENPALHSDWSLRFHEVDDDHLICYSKQTEDQENVIVVVVNLDPYHAHAGTIDLPLEALGLDPKRPYQVHDQLQDIRFFWQGPRNLVDLNPQVMPAHIFRVRRHIRRENDFDYYL